MRGIHEDSRNKPGGTPPGGGGGGGGGGGTPPTPVAQQKGRKAFSSRTFKVAAQKTVTVRLTLRRKAIRILRRGRVETKLRATVVNPGAASRKASWPVRVQLSKKKK
jgi:hypothetical protein